MSEDTTGQEAFAAAMSGADAPSIPDTPSAAPETPSTPAASPAAPSGDAFPSSPSTTAPDGFVPSWRLKEIADERRALATEAAELRRFKQEREAADRTRADEEAAKAAGFDWVDPQGYVDNRLQKGVRQALDPVQQQLRQMAVTYSRRDAERTHGADKVKEAWQAAMQAMQAGDPSAIALNQRTDTSHDPFGEIMDWHRKQEVFTKTGGDLSAFEKRTSEAALEAALKDPAFLQRAMEAARQQAIPVVTGDPRKTPSPSIPSLNRTTSASDAGAEEDDPQAVFRTAQRAGARRGAG